MHKPCDILKEKNNQNHLRSMYFGFYECVLKKKILYWSPSIVKIFYYFNTFNFSHTLINETFKTHFRYHCNHNVAYICRNYILTFDLSNFRRWTVVNDFKINLESSMESSFNKLLETKQTIA